MAAAKCLRLSFGAPSSRTAATPTVQVERLQPSQIIVEGPSPRIIPGGPGRYQWFTLMHSVLRNSCASCVPMSSEQPDACSRYDHPDEARSSLLRKLLKASEHRHRVAAIAASGAGCPATDELRQPESEHFNLAATIKSDDHAHYVNSNAIDESRDRNARKRKYRRLDSTLDLTDLPMRLQPACTIFRLACVLCEHRERIPEEKSGAGSIAPHGGKPLAPTQATDRRDVMPPSTVTIVPLV